MELFATDREKLAFLLEVDAALAVEDEELQSQAAAEGTPDPATSEDRPKYITNYIGSKQKLVDWIWKHTPDTANSVVDAFSGSSVVAYMYKSKGMRVFANDRLRYSYHAARAIIENSSSRLSDDEIDALLADNSKAGSFVQDNFKGLFFGKGVHAIIDSVRANCDALSGFKKDIALFGLGKTCASGGFGHFSSSTHTGMRMATPEKFRESLKANLKRINALVFDNGKENKAYQKDVNELLPKVNADLAYFDPPYATEFSTTNYEKSYHFVEGLMTYWEGKKIVADSKTKFYETDHVTVSKTNADEFFRTFLGNATSIPQWLISYRDHAYPNEQQMKKIIADHGRTSSMKSKSHLYTITAKRGAASSAQERLFICQKAEGSRSNADNTDAPALESQANFHTSFPVNLSAKGGVLSTEAIETGSTVDPQFSFVLCRTGTNKNGDHFTVEELSSRYMTAINKKVDLQHSQEFSDIVGGIVAAEYREDENGGRVECVGELFTNESVHARLSHKLMKRGIISQVSMECDYVEGECSVCSKRFKSKADYCTHLRKYKGSEMAGKPVYEILHGVTFTGLGLLDRKGADENARILQVASRNQDTKETPNQGDPSMDDNNENHGEPNAEAAKKGKEPAGGGATPPADTDLKKENQQLKAKVSELQKRIQELEAEQKAAACKTRAEKLMEKIEKQGVRFASDDERQTEFKRLTALSDEAFAATEAAFSRIPATETKKDEPQGDKGGDRRSQGNEKPNRAEASIRPRDINDGKSSLEDRLKSGFMAAYKNRIGTEQDNNANQ